MIRLIVKNILIKIDAFYNLPEKYKNKENDENKYYSNEDKKYEIDYLKNNTIDGGNKSKFKNRNTCYVYC